MLNKKNSKGKSKGKNNIPKFNFYWVYGIVFVILISINFFNPMNSGILKTNYSEFKQFIEKTQVRKIEVINKKEARVYIYAEELELPPHREKKYS